MQGSQKGGETTLIARSPSEPPAHRYAQQIRAEQVRLLFEQLPAALVATIVVGCLFAYVLWEHVPRLWLATWLTGLIVTTAGREWLRRAYFQAPPPAAQVGPWIRRFLFGTVMSAVFWGIAGAFPIARSDGIAEMFQVFVLAGLAAGGMSTLSSYRGAYVAFLVPSMAPLAIKFMVEGGEVFVAMGTMLVVFVAMMWMISARHYKSVAESLVLRFDNQELLDDLAAARDRQQAINRALEGQMQERLRTAEALRVAYDDLERKVQERTAQLAQTNAVLQTEKELFRVTLASIGDAVITTDAAARITYLNAVAERLTGWTDEAANGHPLTDVFRILDEVTRERVDHLVTHCLHGETTVGPGKRSLLVCRDETELSIDMSMASIRDSDNKSIGVVLVFRDVTEERKLTQQLAHQATHDTLTGLVNRREFERRVILLLSSASADTPHALLYLDLDQFKVVNDMCGHVAGDDLLRQIAALLRTRLRATDTLARLGGDEFGVLLERCPLSDAGRIANSLRELLQSYRFGWGDKSFTVGVSIGLVPITEEGETLAGVFSAADNSCYAAKEKGRNRVHIYQPDDAVLAERASEMRWMPRIQQALAEERLRLYYQPIVPIGSAAFAGTRAEILVRMLDDDGRIVLPEVFLPAAERYGLMLALDRWVVGRSLQVLSSKLADGQDVTFSINISGRSLGAPSFLEFVTGEITASRVPPSKVCFEITETSAIAELAHALRFIETLKALGCQFALDDFGIGLSSFSYLKTLSVDYLKIDGGFVRGLAENETDRAIVAAVHDIGRIMGIKTIAEWVESEAVLHTLRQIGVDYGQGNALGEPQPLDSEFAAADLVKPSG